MGRQMIDKFKEYGLVNSGTAMPTGDKQHPFSMKKVPLRELLNETRNIITKPPASPPLSKDRGPTTDAHETRNIISKPPGSSPLSRDRGPTADTVKLSGTKRQQPDSPSCASSLQPSGNNGANGHLVYVRRKLETEPGKITTSDNVDGADSPDLRKYSNDGMEEPKAQQEPKTTPSPVSAPTPVASWATSSEGLLLPGIVGKPFTGLAATELNSMGSSRIPLQGDLQKSSNPDWKERFLRLQMFLKSCEQSSQDDYIQKLRSLSAASRSRHAVELEKRAIQLLLEEGKELHRMKVLNVLGKALPKDNTSLSTQIPSPLQAQFERDDTTVHAAELPLLCDG